MLLLKPTKLLIRKSNKHIYLQLISLNTGEVVLNTSTLDRNIVDKTSFKNSNLKMAKQLAILFSIRLKSMGLYSIIYNENKYRYHGKIKVILDTLRNQEIFFAGIRYFNK